MDKQTEIIKKRYNLISSYFVVMDNMIRPNWRKNILENLKGNILEVGVGTGANLAYYGEEASVIGIDFSPKMLAKAKQKKAEAKTEITLKEMDVEQLDFPDNTFDYVVSTCVFCSVPNPVKGFREIRRVVKPEGKIIMLEHMRSENQFVGKILDVINPVAVLISGANVNRKTIENIEKAQLKVIKEEFLWTSIIRKLTISPNK